MEKQDTAIPIRILTTLVVLPVVVFLALTPGMRLGFSLFVGLLAAIGLYEYYAIVRPREISRDILAGIVAGTLVTLSGHFNAVAWSNLFLFGGVLLVAAIHMTRAQPSIAGLLGSVFGVFYVGWLAAHITLLRSEPEFGSGLLAILLITVIFSDTAAYCVGSTLGSHKLAPQISPNKTWEGALAGFIAALVGMAVLHRLGSTLDWGGLPAWPLARYIWIGALLTVSAQIGDLMESCLKRGAGVKDSGTFFPGHGGVLDRCDGFLFAAPVLYYIAVLFAG